MEVALVMEEEEEDMVVEDLDMETRVGATEVVMTTMEEVMNPHAIFPPTSLAGLRSTPNTSYDMQGLYH